MNATSAGQARPRGHRIDPKYVPYLVPAIMAIAMSFTMSLVQTIVRVGFSSNLPSAWLTSFAIGVAVAIPTAIFIAPRARRLAGHLTGTPRGSPGAVPERPRCRVSARYHGDCCPACGSHQVIPYAVVVGGSEEYGYQCEVCEVMWPVMTYTGSAADPSGREQDPAA